MNAARARQAAVFDVIGSFKIVQERTVNDIAPNANPIKRPGHTCPSNANAQYFTNLINK